MALELIGGASVGTLFGELVRAFMELKDNAMMFRSSMEQLEATLKSLAPVIKEIQFYNHELNRPQSEIEGLIGVMEGGQKLLCKCSRIRRWYDVRRVRYQKKLMALDKSLLRFLNVDLQAQMARDQKQILLLIKSKILGPDHRGHQDVTLSMTVSQIGPTKRGLMTFELVVEAAFGDVFGELLRACMEAKVKAVILGPEMDQLESALNSLAPEIKHIELYNREFNCLKSEIESVIRVNNEFFVLLEVNVQCDCTGCCQGFILQCQVEVEAIAEDDYMKQMSGAIPLDLWQFLNQQSEPVSKVKRLMASSNKYIVVRYEDPDILSDFSASRILKYDEKESNIEQLALPAADDETSTANWSIMPSSSISEDEYIALRYQNPNISSHPRSMIIASRNPQQYQSASDQNSLRSLECDETNEYPSSEGGNRRHIELLAHPPPADDETSAGELENHEKVYEKMIAHSGAPVQLQSLHILEDTAASCRQKLITDIPYSGISKTGFPNILCHCGTRAAMRILEYERNKDRLYYLCERRNCSFFEWGVPPAASGEVGTSDEFKKMIAQGELGKPIFLAIVLSSVYVLVVSFVVLMYLCK